MNGDRVAPERLERLAEAFRRFGAQECADSSPLYAHLAVRVADDEAMLEIAARAQRGQPAPNMLFAAVQFLLMGGEPSTLARWYPSLAGDTAIAIEDADPYPAFREFCISNGAHLTAILGQRRVQTNEVGRCAVLLPALSTVAIEASAPLGLVEIGASAGLNLLLDHYRYKWEGGGSAGRPDGSPLLTCHVSGALPASLLQLPAIASRLGIDIHPVDLREEGERRWLRALVWPEERDRLARLDLAMAVASQRRPALLGGDGVALLPAALKALPPDVAPCVVHSFTVNQFSSAGREQLERALQAAGNDRPVWRVSMEHVGGNRAELRLVRYQGGEGTVRVLGWCQPHGRWLQWAGGATDGA